MEMAMRNMTLIREAFPTATFTTDLMVGFPGETEEEFQETLAFAREAQFLHIHAFPYSKRAGTPAAVMKDQVPEPIKRARVHQLNDVSEASSRLLHQKALEAQLPLTVLFETFQPETGLYHGHTPDFLEVTAPADCDIRGKEMVVFPVACSDGALLCRILA